MGITDLGQDRIGALYIDWTLKPPGPAPKDIRTGFDPAARQKRQFDQLVAFTQKLMRAGSLDWAAIVRATGS